MSYHSYWWVWIIVIVIIIFVIAGAFFFCQDGGGCPLGRVRRKRTATAVAAGVRFPPENIRASVKLSGDQEVPPVRTGGKGKGKVVVDCEKEQVHYDIHVKKLSSNIDPDIGAHFHVGERGENGPILKELNIEDLDHKYYRLKGVWSSKDAKQPLTQQDLDDLLSGRVYVNVHTLKYPDGEVRGQVSC
uniref:CHRD chordin domain protein n=1 Tax=Pithovirus LCPAC304 TaxID=2506594 RepID=A0A481ZA40_9VIRU|nr:MAG: CHRD chordin domain protein [Pithovirus LCPAC304]